MTTFKKNSDVLGAGDPGALDYLFGILSDSIEDRPSLTDFRSTAWLYANSNPLFPQREKSKSFEKICNTISDENLKKRYLGSVGWQFAHIYDKDKYSFITNFIENTEHEKWIDPKSIYEIMKKGEIFEDVLLKLLPGVKTFGLSGAESFLALVDRIITNSVADYGTDSLVVGGMHRGRLAQMALLFEKPIERIITETKEFLEYDRDFGGSWDSIYHLGWSGVLERASKKIPVWVSPHPSHLSLVASVSMGYAKSLVVEQKKSPSPCPAHRCRFFRTGYKCRTLATRRSTVLQCRGNYSYCTQ
jgi:2-oxoglutarate dehydrogenase complex dehydrogenase (E1) component-like enzyme